MAGTKKRNKNHKSLIAENRFKKTSVTSLRNKPSQKRKSKLPSSSNSSSNFLIKFFKKIIRFFLLIIWGLTWRTSLIIFLGITSAVSYYYLNMKEFSSLLDERARGSVTLEDYKGEVFAWRGDNFSKNLTAKNISPHLKLSLIHI